MQTVVLLPGMWLDTVFNGEALNTFMDTGPCQATQLLK